MAFESLTERLSKTFRNITGKGKLTEKNMEDMLKEVRLALLEADVNYKIVKNFLEQVRQKALGQEVYSALNPGQMVVKIVRDELVALLGEKEVKIPYKESGITTVMMVGLQGTGKTTSCGKIARLAKNREKRKPLMIAADVIRPAAVEQLKVLGRTIGVEVFDMGVDYPALTVVREGMKYARANGYDTVFIDTAGRLHIDEALMDELRDIKAEVKPDEILLTVDAMTGQDIVQVARSFHETLQVSGLVVTKMDGDARGGGVLSVRALTQVPVKFVGQGEKVDEMDYFYPERMAERILGMGDILTLVEQAQEKMDMESAQKTAERMMSGTFTLDDMLAQYEQMSKMGPLGNMMKMIPGLNQFAGQLDDEKASEEMKRQKAIIQSMTKEERQDPSILRASRKNRIAKGSGTTVQEVNKLVNTYEKMKTMFKQMAQMQKSGRMPNMDAMKNAQKQAQQMNMRMPFGGKRRW
ncbi:MAG: signal recognition particle protein [Erysipelotrichaceae bacterium]|nr:signal recognition particle protein [Erysipelotrichaceae bacterium]